MVTKVQGEKNSEETLLEGGFHDEEIRLYELGYHLVPIIAEEVLPEEVSKIKDYIESLGGVIISHEQPKMIQLAYSLSKVVSNKRTFYNSAYFGWIKFQMASGKAPELDKVLRGDDSVLRFIIAKTEEERAPKPPKKMKFFASRGLAPEKAPEEKAGTKKQEHGLTEAELEKTIEELIVE